MAKRSRPPQKRLYTKPFRHVLVVCFVVFVFRHRRNGAAEILHCGVLSRGRGRRREHHQAIEVRSASVRSDDHHKVRMAEDAGNDDVEELREQDRFLPIANINRIVKSRLPQNAKVAKDSKETTQVGAVQLFTTAVPWGIYMKTPLRKCLYML